MSPQLGQQRLAANRRPEQIDVDDSPPLFQRQLPNLTGCPDTSCIDQQVDSRPAILQLVCQLLPAGRLTNVKRIGQPASPKRLNFCAKRSPIG